MSLEKKRLELLNEGQKNAVNQRKEKLADFLIDVSKYVFTGVLVTSLFNEMTNKTIFYLEGAVFVILSLWGGLKLTKNRKE